MNFGTEGGGPLRRLVLTGSSSGSIAAACACRSAGPRCSGGPAPRGHPGGKICGSGVGGYACTRLPRVTFGASEKSSRLEIFWRPAASLAARAASAGEIAACGVDVDVAEHFAYETLHLSNAGIAQAVAGFVTDIWMHEPPPQDTFADQTRLLHHACRADVLHIAQGSDAENRWLPHRPANNFGQDFSHEALPPPDSRQHIAAIETVGSGLAQREGTPQVTTAATSNHISS